MAENTAIKPIEILLVEDSPSDVIMTKEAFDYSKLSNKMHVVENGLDALSFLRREGRYAKETRPDLILLDLNLPKKNGREVLEELKADTDLKIIPVVILTSSRAEEDVLKSYGLHANCYVVKPLEFDNLIEVVRCIHQFWFSVVTLPPERKL
jgi:two-component system, chemotaxis family, response regulator Rcp1